MPPTLANGKICYVEMPAADVARSADLYRRVAPEITARFRDPAGNIIGLYSNASDCAPCRPGSQRSLASQPDHHIHPLTA